MIMTLEEAYRSWSNLSADDQEALLDLVDMALAVMLQNSGTPLTDLTLEVDRRLLTCRLPLAEVNTLLRRHITSGEMERRDILQRLLALLDK